MNNLSEKPTGSASLIKTEDEAGAPDRRRSERVKLKPAAYDPDPYEDLTPAERYSQALLRRDAELRKKQSSGRLEVSADPPRRDKGA